MANAKLQTLLMSLRKLECAVQKAEQKLSEELSPDHLAMKRLSEYKTLVNKQRALISDLLFSRDQLELKQSLTKLNAYSNYIRQDASEMAKLMRSEEFSASPEFPALLH